MASASGTRVLVRVENFGIWLVKVGSWIGRLVLECLDQTVKCDSQERAQRRADPVYPVVAIESVQNDVWAERPRGIEASASEIDA